MKTKIIIILAATCLTFQHVTAQKSKINKRKGRSTAIIPRASSSGLYTFPFKAEDLSFEERVYTRTHKKGIQEKGKDLSMKKYKGNNKWSSLMDGAVGTKINDTTTSYKNSDHYIYNKPFYAIEGGEVIRCWRNAPENPGSKTKHQKLIDNLIPKGGNALWVQHSDGSKALYAHAIPGSIPSSLCPHDAVEGTGTDPDVPPGKRPKVKKGQYLGRVGNSGQSSGPHLHLHVEKGGVPVEMKFEHGLAKTYVENNTDLNGFKSFSGNIVPNGEVLIMPLYNQYARHGIPAKDFQEIFDTLTDAGYEPEWIDGYSVGGKAYLNFVMKPAKGDFITYFGMSVSNYHAKFIEARKKGFTPVFVDSYTEKGKARHIAIFKKIKGGFVSGHDLTYKQHTTRMEIAKKKKLSPVNISVISVGGKRKYTVLYRNNDIGGWKMHSQVKESDYQSYLNKRVAEGMDPIYLNGYKHKGKTYYSTVFAKRKGACQAKHKMTPNSYQSAFNKLVGQGYKTMVITGFDGAAKKHIYGAVWKK